MNSRSLVFLVLIVASLLAGWPVLYGTLILALGNDAYTYILLVAPISLYIIYTRRRIFRDESSWALREGGVLALIAFAAICSVRIKP